MRGPAILPPLRPGGLVAPGRPSPRQRFDALALGIVAEVDALWQHRLGLVEYAVEDAPMIPDDWDDSVPLSSLVRGTGATPTRLVIFRRPIEHRCPDRETLESLVFMVVVEQVAELLGIEPDQVHPHYRRDA